MGIGDPACDIWIAWTLFEGESREIFIQEMEFDSDVWLSSKVWCLWKGTCEICQKREVDFLD